jgi:hypothetical protein
MPMTNARTLTIPLGARVTRQAVLIAGTGTRRFAAAGNLDTQATNMRICATIACQTATTGTA